MGGMYEEVGEGREAGSLLPVHISAPTSVRRTRLGILRKRSF